MISFLCGVYVGGFIVEASTSLFISLPTKPALIGASTWPYAILKLAITFIRSRFSK